MEYIYELILERSENYPPKVKAQMEKFAKKLQSFCYCPVLEKEFARMEPFATQEELVKLVFEIIKNYEILDDPYGIGYDLVGYWYCIALLSLS